MPITNGTIGGRESLQDVCKRLHDKVEAFLAAEAKTNRQRETQEQTKVAQGVIRKALEDYTYDRSHSPSSVLTLTKRGGE